MTYRTNTVVIGAGQAGLSVGYHLAKRKIPFLLLDANPRIGDAWRNRWDSLRLFTPARYVNLPGLSFPGRGDAFPSKDQMADFLEQYAEHFRLPVQTSTKVEKLYRHKGNFVIETNNGHYEADQVVVAMANYQAPHTPEFAAQLDPGIRQLHAHKYRNPAQLQAGGVLVVGVGNSGADISMEVARTHKTWLSGKESGSIPWPIESFFGRNVLVRFVRFLGHNILNVDTPVGRKARPKMIHRAAPLVRVKPQDLLNAGIQRVSKVIGVRDGLPLLAENTTLDIKNVIWCTGYKPGFSWIDLPIFNEQGDPYHERGVVHRVPGMYFVGLHFQYAMTSATVTGVGRDAEHIVKAIEKRRAARKVESTPRLLAASAV